MYIVLRCLGYFLFQEYLKTEVEAELSVVKLISCRTSLQVLISKTDTLSTLTRVGKQWSQD